MKNYLLPALLILLTQTLSGQYARVRIALDQPEAMPRLAALGLDMEHGIYYPEKYFEGDFSQDEIARIRAGGWDCEVLIEDVQAWYQSQPLIMQPRNFGCNTQAAEIPDPANFSLGSMAGYFTYEEMLAQLEAMHTLYPDLITAAAPVASIETYDDSLIYFVRISDNAALDESEPEALYTALHHAREPGSLSQLIYFMWYLLENYDSDPEVQYLLDHTELYFIPCVNPDGYRYNTSTNPDGGGMWRKNRRSNNDGSFGVDLNRNYGTGWGYDDWGSSPAPSSGTYRGPEAFSEPETQAVTAFCLEHDFRFALNYHTFGNLLIYPWGYLDAPTPDSTEFECYSDLLTRENNYKTGRATETVGYQVNGTSDDWMYDAAGAFSMTPEVGPGSYGFWPPASEIINLCRSAFNQNLTLARLLGRYGVARDLSGPLLLDNPASVAVELKRFGLQDGPLTLRLTPISPEIVSVSAAQELDLLPLESAQHSFDVLLSDTLTGGNELIFLLEVDNGLFSWQDTLRKIFYPIQESVIQDAFQTVTLWNNQTGGWDLTSEQYLSAPASMTDSPGSAYAPFANNLLLSEPLELDSADAAYLFFHTRWDIESGFDYAQVWVTDLDGNFLAPLCGQYTHPADGPGQPTGDPVYDGQQFPWVAECMSLDPWIGQGIRIAFLLVSDGGVERDGFYLDDLEIRLGQQGEINTIQELELSAVKELRVSPNPTTGDFQIFCPQAGILEGFDPRGARLWQTPVAAGWQELQVPGSISGPVLLRLRADEGKTWSARLLVHRP